MSIAGALQLLMECCNTATLACPTLKATYPGIYLGDSSTGYPDGDYPNFCYVHGVTCSRYSLQTQHSMPASDLPATDFSAA